MKQSTLRKALEYQGYHLAVYLVVGALLYAALRAFPEGQRTAWGMSTAKLIAISWMFVGVMQFWIAACGRLELYYGKMSAWFGAAGFTVFRIGFVLLALPRLLLIIPIAQSSPRTLGLPLGVRAALVVITTPFILWGVYSVLRYFGINRVLCADHFDASYRGGSLVKGGLFKYLPNVGYAVILTAIYHPALFFDSLLGLLAAAAHHALVWTAYFCTEKPDMREIYGVNR